MLFGLLCSIHAWPVCPLQQENGIQSPYKLPPKNKEMIYSSNYLSISSLLAYVNPVLALCTIPRMPYPLEQKPPASLLVDIQAKLQEGKGEGYVRWAKGFNLKQAAQTLIYLQENNLLEYGDLEKRTCDVTERYHSLSVEMKNAEARISEIKNLQQHIINYSKTRGTYIAYREAGYSKKFRQEHEADILLHQTAKKFFDEQGLTKLPTLKSLQQEYSDLLSRKKGIYPEYRKLRTEMKDLLTVKANVDRLLNMEAQPEKEEHKKHR